MLKRNSLYFLIALGCLFQAGLFILILLGNLTLMAGQYIALCAGLFTIFGLAGRLVLTEMGAERISRATGPGGQLPAPLKNAKPALLVILFFAVMFRLTMVLVAPTLSTDQFRYTWEGRLVTQGVSPYRYAPNDPALVPYHSEIWPLVQQADTTSPYPPLNQLIGVVEYLTLGDSLLGPKLAAAFFDILTCLALVWLLGLYGFDRRRVILYAWCPLPVIEFGQSGHNDAPMLLLLIIGLGLAQQKRPALSALVVGLACLAKFTPLFVLPLFVASWQPELYRQAAGGWGRRVAGLFKSGWRYPALTVLVIAAGYLPFLIAGKGAIGSILEYTGSWRDNESMFFQWTADFLSPTVAKVGSLIILGGVLGWLSLSPRAALGLSLPRRLMLGLGATLLVASTVHTWYLTWIMVLVPVVWASDVFAEWDWGWVSFAALVELPYLTYIYFGNTPLYNWIRPVEFWPVHVFIGWNLWRLWRSRNPASLAGEARVENHALTNAEQEVGSLVYDKSN